MALTLQQIISEADVLVPNAYSDADKVSWLNQINQEFMEVVRIPSLATFNSAAGTASYTLTGTLRTKGIDKVQVGTSIYRNILYEDVKPADNYFTYNEATQQITLSPSPSRSDQIGKVRYSLVATSSFTSGSLSVNPDAPAEYHWIYVLGLCEFIAKAGEENAKAVNYGNQYRSALTTAAQNYQKVAQS